MTGETTRAGDAPRWVTMHLGRVPQHIVKALADVFAVLDRRLSGRVNVEVVAEFARGRVYKNRRRSCGTARNVRPARGRGNAQRRRDTPGS